MQALRLRTRALDGLGSAVVVINVPEGSDRGFIEYTNEAFTRIMGYPREEVLGRRSNFLVVDDVSTWSEIGATVNAEGHLRAETKLRHKDGHILDADITLSISGGHDGKPRNFIAVFNDVSHQKQAAAREAQAERLRSLGQLTSAVAHDFNNFIAVIRVSAELLLARDLSEAERRMAERILRTCEAAVGRIKPMVAFSRMQQLTPKLIDVGVVVREFTEAVANLLGVRLTLVFRLDGESPHAIIDETQLQSCILNLAINSRDSMPNGGEIIVEVGSVTGLPEAAIGNPGIERARPYARVSVIDTGLGMPEEVRRKALEPFFTTKAAGAGTGLGLSTVLGFVQQSGGALLLESVENVGTTVSLCFPRALN